MSSEDENAIGVINPDHLYTLRAFKLRLGIRDSTLRSARRRGLRVVHLHKQGYVFGRDWIEYVLKENVSGPQGDNDALVD